MRARFQEGRVARLRVQIVDAPGALVRISTLLASQHANVVDVSHHRAFSGVPAKCAELDFTIEVRHPSDVYSILEGPRVEALETTLLTGADTRG
ncbi:MAG: ACT domain-containing protein [Mycobacterium sp.]|nr:ACT domain-containing protein [Mycobacterium sp.]